jgi:hypothetical protein
MYKRSKDVQVDNVYKRSDLRIPSIHKMKRGNQEAQGVEVDEILLKRGEQVDQGVQVDEILLK